MTSIKEENFLIHAIAIYLINKYVNNHIQKLSNRKKKKKYHTYITR